MYRIYRNVLVVALACFVALASCKKDNSSTGQPAQAAMGQYAEGYNKLLDKVKSMVSRYESAFPDGPTDKIFSSKPHLFSEHSFAARAIEEAKKSFEAAKSAAPASMSGLAADADALIKASESVLALYSDVYKYYDAEDYKDDKLAKGKELHTKFVEAAKQYRAAIGKLGDGLDKIEDEQSVVALKEFEKDKGYSYWFRKFNMEAKKLVNAAQKAESPEQLAALEAAYKPVAELRAELGKFVAAKGSSINSTFRSYADSTDDFDGTCRKLLRAIKEATPDKMEPVEQEMEHLISGYNSLVSMANALYQVEDVGQLK